MKLKLLVSLTLLFMVIIGFFVVQNKQLKDRVFQAEVKKEELQMEQEMAEMRQYFSTQPVESNIVHDYHTWVQSKELAEQFYEDSDGKFEMEWGLFLGEVAQQKEIDPYIVYELLRTETGDTFDPNLVGPETKYGKAYGMAQFMKNTAPWIAEMAGLEYKDELLFDPLFSIQLSIEYLSFLYDRYDNWDYALTAYHRGMYGLEAYIKENGHAESWYAVEIQDNANQFEQVVFND
ncbi:lytic transglycosylase domain-containing protein [Alkalihalobacillus sp. 1P02AB]|uniref:lytic transglycosylase domain-containing protein n=1 Tax=Alkalihalobacillus sp. 1P02AB TaxID=3132260 RepID=UPI0039A76A0C